MNIGMDMQALRWVPAAGLFYHVWNLFTALRDLPDTQRMIPFLYGHPGLIESEQVRTLRDKGLHRDLRYAWDGPSIPLMSTIYGRALQTPPAGVRYLDRRLLFRAWRRLHGRSFTNGKHADELKSHKAFADIEVFHHVELPLFPADAFPTNVMTIPDLTTIRVPGFHQEQNVDLVSDIQHVAPRMDALITESEHTKRDVVELLGVEPERVFVTPLAAHEQFKPTSDESRRQAVLVKHGLRGQPFVLTVGTLEPRKNHKRLIDAFRLLKSNGQLRQHRLVLVGGKGWLFDEIFAAIADYGLEAEVKWLGYVPYDELPVLMSAADVFAYPSLYEGFGLPPLEAMSCGAAVVASNTTSIPEVVGDGGLLVDPENTEAIAAAINDIVTNPQLGGSLRQKALARAQTFTWERTARQTLAAYEAARQWTKNQPPNNQPKTYSSRSRDNMRQWVLDQLYTAYGR